MSAVFYNGVSLPYPLTTTFRTSAMYDDESRTDWWGTQFDISWTFLINTEYLGMLAPGLVGLTGNPAAIMQNIRARLMQPRRAFSYTFNGVDLVPNTTAGAGLVDIANGPQPQYCDFSQMAETMFFVQYAIRATYWENNAVPSPFDGTTLNQAGNPVLFNRWRETVDIDALNYSTRTRSGKYRIRSDNRDGRIADRYREQLAVVGKPAGFVRKSSSYTVTPDGLSIEYQVVDKETYKSYPFPAFEADGEYTETSSKLGSILHGEVRVHLKGSKRADPEYSFARLIETAVGVAAGKLDISGARLFDIDRAPILRGVLEYTVVRMDLYESDVEVRMRARYPITIRRIQGVPSNREKSWAKTPGSTVGEDVVVIPAAQGAGWRPNLDIRGNESSFKVLQAAAYYDPSILDNNGMNPATGQMVQGLAPGEAGRLLEP